MFSTKLGKAGKELALSRCLVPGPGDLVAVSDETVSQCLSASLAFIISQAAVGLGDVMRPNWFV